MFKIGKHKRFLPFLFSENNFNQIPIRMLQLELNLAQFPLSNSACLGKRFRDPGQYQNSSLLGSLRARPALNSQFPRSLRLTVGQTSLSQYCWQNAPLSGLLSQGLERQDRCVTSHKHALSKGCWCQKILATCCEEQRRNKIKAFLTLHVHYLQKPQL